MSDKIACMSLPDYQTVMLPLLKYLGDRDEHSVSDSIEAVSDEFTLSAEERLQLLPSGTSTIIGNRVAWARTYMKKAGLLESPRRGFIRITQRGLDILNKRPLRIEIVPA